MTLENGIYNMHAYLRQFLNVLWALVSSPALNDDTLSVASEFLVEKQSIVFHKVNKMLWCSKNTIHSSMKL